MAGRPKQSFPKLPQENWSVCIWGTSSYIDARYVKIIVHGGPTATEALLESCANIRNMTKDIYAPAEGESVQIGQNTNSYSISLSDEMLASVRMSRVSLLEHVLSPFAALCLYSISKV
jgi:hypothetical protein